MSEWKLLVFRVFRIKYDKLIALRESDNPDDILEISALLRHFLLDGNRLADDVATEIGTACSFPITDDYSVKKHAVFRMGYTPRNNATTFYNRQNFLNLSCFEINREILTVKETIELGANCVGGVHHDGKSDLNRNAFAVLEEDISSYFLECLHTIAESVIEGLSELRLAIERRSTFLEQRKRSKQPEILISTSKETTFSFTENSSLEGYAILELGRSGSIIFTFVPPKEQKAYPATLLEIGSRKTGDRLSMQIQSSETLVVELHQNSTVVGCCSIQLENEKRNAVLINHQIIENVCCFEVINKASNIYQNTFNAQLKRTTIEGKITFGQSLNSRNGASFQSQLDLIFFNQTFGSKEFENVLFLISKNKHVDTWISSNIVQDRAFVTRIYNQAQSSDDTNPTEQN